MAINFKYFESHNDYKEYIKQPDAILPNISYCEDLSELHYNSVPPPKPTYENYHLAFIPLEGDMRFCFSSDTPSNTLMYSLDDGDTWEPMENNVMTPYVSSGETIMFKGECTVADTYGIGYFRSGGVGSTAFKAYGNPMSLLYGDDFTGRTDLPETDKTFFKLFAGTGVEDASDLALVATDLPIRGYYGMFSGCTNLKYAPELPATGLSDYAYTSIFDSCTRLVTAPKELPATDLSNKCCYRRMFFNCHSLEGAPELRATTIGPSGYSLSFAGCSALKKAPEMSAATSFSGASGCAGMFSGCTAMTESGEICATTIGSSCFRSMFAACSSMTKTASILPATTLTDGCYREMYLSCKALEKAPELPAVNLDGLSSPYYRMFMNCTSLNYIKAMFVTEPLTVSSGPTYQWVSQVPTTGGTFVKNSAATWTTVGTNGVPSGWTIEYADA